MIGLLFVVDYYSGGVVFLPVCGFLELESVEIDYRQLRSTFELAEMACVLFS
jgi:hypothetical protein